jgi:hypothetical protein
MFNFAKLEPFTMRLLVRQTLRAVMFAGAISGFVLSASAARADWHERDGDWHGHDRGWHGDRDWHSRDRDWHHDRDWRWRGGVFLGVPAPFYVAPPVYNVPPPAYYYYSPYGY